MLHEVTTPAELIDKGLIVSPKVLGLSEPNLLDVPMRAGDFAKEEVAKRCEQYGLVGDIVDSWIKHANGKPTVLFAASISHSKQIAERFASRGIRIAHLDGTTPAEERSRILARLSIGGTYSGHPEALDIVSNVGVLAEGWDSASDYQRVINDKSLWLGKSYPPEYQPLEVLSDCDPTDSSSMYRQREGRICRSHEKKSGALILSHSGNWRRHGFLRNHHGFALDSEQFTSKPRKALRASELARQCETCLSVWPGNATVCEFCKSPLMQSKEVAKERAVELIDVSNVAVSVPAPNPPAERAFLKNLWVRYNSINAQKKLAGKPPMKEGWVAALFKSKFGRWPSAALLSEARKKE